MKRLFLTVLAVLGFAITASAQEVQKTKKVETTKVVKHKDGDVKKKTETTVVLKKDGTPDKRYKTTKKVVLKKDGTPDKRYK